MDTQVRRGTPLEVGGSGAALPDVQLAPVDAHDRPAERAHALIDVGPRAPAAGAALDHPRDLLLAPLDPPAVEDHLGPLDVGERPLEVVVVVGRPTGDDEEEPVAPLPQDVRDVEDPDQLAEAPVDHARIAAVHARHRVDLIDSHAALLAVLRPELDPSRGRVVHRSPPRENPLRGDTLAIRPSRPRRNSDTREVGAVVSRSYRIWWLVQHLPSREPSLATDAAVHERAPGRDGAGDPG